MKDLSEIRKDIDVIDRQIIDLYKQRMELTTEVAEYKISTGKAVLDRQREKSKLDTLSAMVDTEFSKNGVRELFGQIMSTSRKKQYQLLTERGRAEELGLTEIPELKKEGIRVVYQGVEMLLSRRGVERRIAVKETCYNPIDVSVHSGVWQVVGKRGDGSCRIVTDTGQQAYLLKGGRKRQPALFDNHLCRFVQVACA